MAKGFLAIIVSALVLISVLIWLLSSEQFLFGFEIIQILIIAVLIGFGFLMGYRRIKSRKADEPGEDELSKKILMKSASISYYVSIYIWLAILYLNDESSIKPNVLIRTGIVVMAITLFITWVIIRLRGVKDV